MLKLKSHFILLAGLNFLFCLLLISQLTPLIKSATATGNDCDNPYLPFNQGTRIEYKSTDQERGTHYIMEVVESKPGFAKIKYEFISPSKIVMSQNLFCQDGAITTDTYMDFASSAGSVRMNAQTKDVNGELMPKDLKVGSNWVNKFTISYDYGGDNIPANMGGYVMAITTTNKVLAEEKVSVPAGTFTAFKVESISSLDMSLPDISQMLPESVRSNTNMPEINKMIQQQQQAMAATSTSVTMYQWWVKNIGLVKITTLTGGREHETVAVKIGAGSFLDNPTLEAVAEKGVAPAAAVVAVANTAIATQSVVSIDFLRYLIFFLTQPLLLLRKKKTKAWGTVYNSLSGLPEDLAVIRLFDAVNNKLVTTQVTDTNGAFSFLVPAGQYKMVVSKNNFIFPSVILKDKKTDDQYADLYHGETIKVDQNGAVLLPNIPLDPNIADIPDAKIKQKASWQKYQSYIALISPALGAISFIIKPSLIVTILFILSIVTYLFFRRFAMAKTVKKWGKVLEDKALTAIPGVVMRIFALPFNRLFAYRVTDNQGRYNFLVGNRKFVLSVTKDGYEKQQTKTYDFSQEKEATVIADDISLKKV